MTTQKNAWILTLFFIVTTTLYAAFVFPTPEGAVTDRAQIFDVARRSTLVRAIEHTAEATGTQIALLTVDSTEGLSAETFANEVMAQWPHEDNALLLVWIAQEATAALVPSETLEQRLDFSPIRKMLDPKRGTRSPDEIITQTLDTFTEHIRQAQTNQDMEATKQYMEHIIQYMLIGTLAVGLLYRFLPIEGRYLRAAVIATGSGIVAAWALHDVKMGSLTFAIVFILLIFSRRYLWWGAPTIADADVDLGSSNDGDAGGSGDAGGDAL